MLLLHGEHDFIARAPGLEHKSGTRTAHPGNFPVLWLQVPLEHAQRHYDAAVHSSQRELVVLDADHNTLAGAAQLGCGLAGGLRPSCCLRFLISGKSKWLLQSAS